LGEPKEDNKEVLTAREFEEVFDLYYTQVRNFLYYKTSKSELSEDVAQDAFVKLWETRNKIDKSSLKAYLFTIANNLMINKLDPLSYDADGAWNGGELLICVGYRTPDGEVLRHVPRDPVVHRTLEPVYRQYAGWREDLTGIRTFDNLPLAAKRYIAGMARHTLEIAFGEDLAKWPRDVPELRYVGVGPEPSQIIKDVPPMRELVTLAD